MSLSWAFKLWSEVELNRLKMEEKEKAMKKENKLVYLASPYSHRLKKIRQRRFEQVAKLSSDLAEFGITNFSPIIHSHIQNEFNTLPQGWKFWQQHDQKFLERCDELVVVCLNGWEKSKGVKAEINIAKKLGIPVKYVDADGGFVQEANHV